MSRPCFALSVMLCCLAGPLSFIGRTHAQDTVVSPSHDPGECVVCPLAHGSLDVCGGYSDYDYNDYWYDDASPAAESAAPVDPELEVADSLTDDAASEAWESDYEDYYADYAFGDEPAAADDATAEAVPATAPPNEAPAESESPAEPEASLDDSPQGGESPGYYDEFGWYTDDTAASDDYFDLYESYEPIEAADSEATEPEATEPEATEPEATEPEATEPEASIPDEAAIDYEAYEEEWFSYGAETTVEDADVTEPEVNQAYDALSESAAEADAEVADSIEETPAADSLPEDQAWGDEDEWYREEYGYDADWEPANVEAADRLDPMEQLETGYDEAYDEAMVPTLEAGDPVADSAAAETVVEAFQPDSEPQPAVEPDADVLPEESHAELVEDEYESFSSNDDDLYHSEPDSVELSETDSAAPVAEPVCVEQTEQVTAPQPAWLVELVDRMLAPVWTAADRVTAHTEPGTASSGANYVGPCAQEWDCELNDWARPQVEPPSVVLGAADTLDEVASLLQEAAQLLRGFASGQVAETAQAAPANASR